MYLYITEETKKVHIKGEYAKYLIDDSNINYMNIAYDGNEVYFIPCFDIEYNKLPKTTIKPYKITKINDNRVSFNLTQMTKHFNLATQKPKQKNRKNSGYILPYHQENIDFNRKSIKFTIPDTLIPQKKEVIHRPFLTNYEDTISKLPIDETWGKDNSDSYWFFRLYFTYVELYKNENKINEILKIKTKYNVYSGTVDDKIKRFIKNHPKNTIIDLKSFNHKLNLIMKYYADNSKNQFKVTKQLHVYDKLINEAMIDILIELHFKTFVSDDLPIKYQLGLKYFVLLKCKIIKIEDIKKYIVK